MNEILTPKRCKQLTNEFFEEHPDCSLKESRIADIQWVLNNLPSDIDKLLEFGAWPTDSYKVFNSIANYYMASDSFAWCNRTDFKIPKSKEEWIHEISVAHIPGRQIDVEDYFDLEKWDAIISISVLEHVHHDKKAVKNIYNALKPGGHFIFTTEFNLFQNLAYRRDIYFRVYDPNGIGSILKDAGFIYNPIISFPEDDPFISRMGEAKDNASLLVHPYKYFCSAGFIARKPQ